MFKIIIFTIFLMVMQTSYADWYPMFKNQKDVYSIDKDSMVLDFDKNTANIWVKEELSLKNPKKNDIKEKRSNFFIMCNSRKMFLKSSVFYGSEKEVVKNFNPSTPMDINLVPDTVGSNIYTTVCDDILPVFKNNPIQKLSRSYFNFQKCYEDNINNLKLVVYSKDTLKNTAINRCSTTLNYLEEDAIEFGELSSSRKLTEDEKEQVKNNILNKATKEVDAKLNNLY